MTINATAATLLAMYIVVAEERGIRARDARAARSRTTSSRSTSRAARTSIRPRRASRSSPRSFRFCADGGAELESDLDLRLPHPRGRRDGGAGARVHLRERDGVRARARVDAGLAVDDFAPRLSFFFAAHNDLFEEVAKFRAARRMYARLMRERFGASDASCRLRFHTQTGGVTLTAQQPLNNVVRVTVQALAAVLGGTQSLHTNGYDEALALPTAEAATLALRTQQIVALRVAASRTPSIRSPAATTSSSSPTSSSAARCELIEQVDELGGAARAIAAGFFQEEIARSAYEHQLRVERGETVIVGVNRFADGEEPPVDPGARLSRRSSASRSRGSPTCARSATRRRSQRRWPRSRDAAAAYVDAGAAGATAAHAADHRRGARARDGRRDHRRAARASGARIARR